MKPMWLKGVGISLLVFCLSAQGQGYGQPVAANQLLVPDDAVMQATMYPKLTLLHGPILVVKFFDPTHFIKSDVYTGSGFIVGIYKGKEDINNVKSPLLIEDLSQIQTIANLDILQSFDPTKTGRLAEQILRKANFVLVYYNTNGYPLMLSMVNYGVHGLNYDLTQNHIDLELSGVEKGKFLQGLVVNFK